MIPDFSISTIEGRVQGCEATIRELVRQYEILENRYDTEINRKRGASNSENEMRYRLEASLRQAEEHVLTQTVIIRTQ